MWSFLEFWRARTALMRFALLENSSRWNPRLRRKDFSRTRVLGYTTHLYRLLQHRNWSLKTTCLRLLVGLSFCLNMSEVAFIVINTAIFSLVIRTHGRMPKSTWRIFTEFESAWKISLLSFEFSYLLPDPCEDFCSSPSVCFAFEWDAGEDDRPFRLWPSPLFPEARRSWQKLHGSPVEHWPCAFHWKHSPTFFWT